MKKKTYTEFAHCVLWAQIVKLSLLVTIVLLVLNIIFVSLFLISIFLNNLSTSSLTLINEIVISLRLNSLNIIVIVLNLGIGTVSIWRKFYWTTRSFYASLIVYVVSEGRPADKYC